MNAKVLEKRKKIKSGKRDKRNQNQIFSRSEEDILSQNKGLVFYIARQYLPFVRLTPSSSIEDLVQEGFFGLILAIRNFDPKKSKNFSQYATMLIRRKITDALPRYGKVIRLPDPLRRKGRQFTKAKMQLERKLGGSPSIAEIAKELNISIEKAREIEDFLRSPMSIVSLDTSLISEKDGGRIDLGDLIEDKNIKSPEEETENNLLKEIISEFLEKTLGNEKKEVVKMRFGLEDGKELSIKEISQRTGFNLEKVHNLLKTAIKKLKTTESPQKNRLEKAMRF